jgi:hypothetical protein
VRVDSIDASAVMPWLELLRAVHPALRPSRVAIGFATVLLIAGVGRVWDLFASPASYEPLSVAVREGLYGAARGVAHGDTTAIAIGLRAALWDAPHDSWQAVPWFTACFALVALAIYGLGAGVLARLFAGDIAHKAWRVADARAFLRPRRIALATAPLTGVVIGAALWGVLAVVGVLFHIPLFNVVAAALGAVWLALAWIALVAIAAVAIGLPLLAPATACDGCDGIESAQRAGAYIFARPFHALWFAVVSLALLLLSAIVFDGIAAATWHLALSGLSATGGASEPMVNAFGTFEFLHPASAASAHSLGMTDSLAASVMDFWRSVLRLLVGGAILSTLVSLATRSYLLLRRECDGQDLTDIWEDAARDGAGRVS